MPKRGAVGLPCFEITPGFSFQVGEQDDETRKGGKSIRGQVLLPYSSVKQVVGWDEEQ
jgi:hypothetical protein